LLDSGVINTKPEDDYEIRLYKISQELEGVLNKYKPVDLAIEDIFSKSINPRIGLKIALVVGVILKLSADFGMKVYSYPPKTVKLAITGRGSASKEQIIEMVANLFGVQKLKNHISDACAVAYCHLNRRNN
jgi:crossover junction endodeoxyribonuclease RuvC